MASISPTTSNPLARPYARPAPSRPKRTIVQRAHGTVLILAGLALAVATTRSQRTGTGLYPFLQQNPMAHVGLLQAYLLMAIIGAILWIGALSRDPSWKWDVIGIIAHVPPLLALGMYWQVFVAMGYADAIPKSLALHLTCIAVELYALFGLRERAVCRSAVDGPTPDRIEDA